jgi:hypothetical protein
VTPRARMLTAYRHGVPDRVPVSPELWDATAIAVSGRPFHELVGPFAEVPWWRTHLAAFDYFGADAWILAMPGETGEQRARRTEQSAFLDDETIETRTTYHTSRGDLFTSFLGTVREGGMGQTLFDLIDEPDYCTELQARYRDFLCDRTRAVLSRTRTQALFIHGGY